LQAVARPCELRVYLGICRTTEEKARKNLSQGKETSEFEKPQSGRAFAQVASLRSPTVEAGVSFICGGQRDTPDGFLSDT
jgi:hypothetical protein